MKYILISILLLLNLNLFAQQKTFHDFKVMTIDGDSISLSEFAGKKKLVVNTASYCGYTYQYADLQDLYETYGPDDFVIIGFPANNFANQEPGSNDDIKDFCTSNYGVTFPMMAKISVKGTDIHPVYQWLTQKSENGVEDAPVQWNFQKFMIDEWGRYVDYMPTQSSPKAGKIIDWITTPNNLETTDPSEISLFFEAGNGILYLSGLGQDPGSTLKVYSANGKLIKSVSQVRENEVYCGILPKGLYIVKLISAGKATYAKFLVR